jgi:hypothetical protein
VKVSVPGVGKRNHWFFQALESFTEIFPRLGWREARHMNFRADFSRAWKKGGDFFQGLENTASP